MEQQKQKADFAPPPNRPQLLGTPLVHYGPLWDEGLEQAGERAEGPVAVLVCHGMGQQVRYETISSIAEAILEEAGTAGGTVLPVEVHLSKENGSFLARAEIHWIDKGKREHNVHVYEAYWAPLTEGRVTYWDTVKFLLLAAWNGLKFSLPFGPRSFERWIFGGRKTMRIGRATFFALLCVLSFLALQVGVIGFVLFELAQQYKLVLSQATPSLSIVDLLHPGSNLVHAWLRWLGPFFPGHEILLHSPAFVLEWWWAIVKLTAWFATIAEALFARYFLIEYVGDVAAYISPYKDSKFEAIRQQIQKIGLDVGKLIYGFGGPFSAVPHYEKVVVVGHSLGSVLAYDTLNALINQDNVSAPPDRRDVVRRTRALVTFGSPLDKTAFIFRMQVNSDQGWIREQLVASAQPLIVNYPLYRPISFDWVNIWSRMDIISGELNYYDDPSLPPNVAPCVQNKPDPEARTPLLAHVQYWNNQLLRQQLYRFLS